MGMKQGYKQTDIGLIPEDWDAVPLLSKCDLLNGLTYTPDDVVNNGLLVLRSSNIQHSKLVFLDNVFVNLTVDKKQLVKKNDIIICVRNGSANLIGKCAKAEKDYNATFGAFMAVLRGVNNDYIYQILQQGTIQKLINKNSDSTINQITNGDFKSIKILFPAHKNERSRIAEALSDVDEMISSLEKLIEKKKAIKQGVMQELLTGKRRLPGFTGEWICTNHLFEVEKGKQINGSELDDSLPYPLYNGGISASGNTSDYNYENKVIISEGGNSCGYVNYVKMRFWAGGHCYVVINSKVSNEYLFQLLKSRERDIMALRMGSGLPNIQKDELKKLKYCYPKDPGEQKAITCVLEDMDKDIDSLISEFNKYRMLKFGMMSDLLTGKIRLI